MFPRFNPTLWILFMTALTTTFILYRIAEYKGIKGARAPDFGPAPDKRLVLGSLLFGLGWGITGLCPGPVVVAVGAAPTEGVPLLTLLSTMAGIKLATLFDPQHKAKKSC